MIKNNPNLDYCLSIPNTGVILIDMQEEFLGNMSVTRYGRLVASQKFVLKKAVEKNLPIFEIRYFSRYDDFSDTIPILTKNIEDYPKAYLGLKKNSESAFDKGNLESNLEKENIKHLFLMGVNASLCVLETAIDALDKYFISTSPHVIADNKIKKLPCFYKRESLYFLE